MPQARNVCRGLFLALPVLAASGWATHRGIAAWRYASELDRAEREVAARQFEAARDRLRPLASAAPGVDEVEYPLGVCEASLGDADAAIAAWRRIPDDSVIAPRAKLEIARAGLARGRLAAAEEALASIENAPGDLGDEAAKLAQQLDLFSGRAYRIPERIERRWSTMPDQAKQLRVHWLYETQPFPAKEVGEALERLGRDAPDDDRIWLGKADLATRLGQYDEADTLLTRCETRRPDDPDVRRARLFWALDARRLEAAEAALKQTPAILFTSADLATIAARVAELRGDARARREALERRVELEPGDSTAWGRLAELASREPSGGKITVETARARKAEIDRASDIYRIQMGEVATGDLSKVTDLARTAATLDRRFEALGWWRIHLRTNRSDEMAIAEVKRLSSLLAGTSADATPSGRMLAELIPAPGKAAIHVQAKAGAGGQKVPAFRDLAEASGLRFTYDSDPTDLRRLPETMGGGLALIDYDGDGYLDVYTVQGGRFPAETDGGPDRGDRLFRNNGDGTFRDATEAAGIHKFPRGYGHGVAVGDIDNDGHPDLFVTRWRSYALYRNRGDGTFEDATARYGLGGERGWPTSAGFADLDDDGDLDLYVCQYLEWDPRTSAPCPDPDRPGRNLYCVPRAFRAERDRLFRNDGGKFTDVTEAAGIVDNDGRGLGVVLTDLDGDHRLDIFVANDMTANLLFRNLGGMKFEEVGAASGAASSGSGGYQAGMGIACGDLDGDGKPDLVVTNFHGESATLYGNLGGGLFADSTAPSGLQAPTRFLLGFGTAFLDADNDGRLDLAIANGHVNDFTPAIPYAMPAQLFLGDGKGRLSEVTGSAGPCWSQLRVGRGMAVGDIDNDGRTDLLILAQNGPVAYFRNDGPAGRSLTLSLRGSRSNRDAVGATVRVTTGGHSQVTWRMGGGSFLSTSDPRLHFGLPAGAETADVEIRWPSGRTDRHPGLKAGGHAITEAGDVGALKGWPGPDLNSK